MKKKAYVIGNNAKHSLSPYIFNYWFKQNNINGQYLYKQIDPKNFNQEVDIILSESSVCGFNVTIPFKELIKNKLDKIDIHSKKIGAINCVTKKENIWSGSNTDWIGFLQSIKEGNKILKKNIAIVIGYGGAAKAVIYALKKEGFNEIKVFNRSIEKIKHIKEDEGITTFEICHLPKHLENADLVVNATPTDVLKSLKNLEIASNTVACDIIYKPKETSFLSNFLKSRRIYGISMLLNQAAPCFEEWFGVKPNIDQGLLGLLRDHLS